MLGVIMSVSLAALIFSGHLKDHLSYGIGMALFSATISALIIALFSSYPGAIATPQNRITPILALLASVISIQLSKATSEVGPETVLVAIASVSAITGISLSLLGLFRLGSMIRFIPYSVVGGVIGGTGWLLTIGAIRVMMPTQEYSFTLQAIFHDGNLKYWLPGFIYGLFLFLILRRFRQVWVMPTCILSGIALFYGVLLFHEISFTDARLDGWIFPEFAADNFWQPLTVAAWPRANWGAIFENVGAIGTIVLISAVSVLLTSSALELDSQAEVDLNRELNLSGMTNILCSMGGGMVSFHSLSLSLLVSRLNGASRFTGIVTAFICGLALMKGAMILSFVPIPLAGGILTFLGLSFLVEWLYDAAKRMPVTDYVVIVIIVGATACMGFPYGVGIGLIAAIVLFVVKYSQVNSIRQQLSGDHYRSNVDRSLPQDRTLSQYGGQTQIFRLQGFMFFGTAFSMFQTIRDRVENELNDQFRYLILDFKFVTGLDYTTIDSFVKLRNMCQMHNALLLFSNLSPVYRNRLISGGFVFDADSVTREFSDLDHAMEFCEDGLLCDAGCVDDSEENSILMQMRQQFPHNSELEHLFDYLHRLEIPEAAVLIRQGDQATNMFFVESGKVSTSIETSDGKEIRLRTMGPGTIVGELGFYLNQRRAATVYAVEATTVYQFALSAKERMEASHPRLAADFHQFMARSLCDRLTHTLEIVENLTH